MDMFFSFTIDGFRILQLILTIFAFSVAVLFSGQYFRKQQIKLDLWHVLTGVATLIGTLGVFISGDFLTMFFFFEIMSFASYGWVLMGKDKKVSTLYLYVSLIAGMTLLMGLFMLYGKLGTLSFAEIKTAASSVEQSSLYLIGALILIGFGTKAGLYPLHIWLRKTYVSTPTPYTAVFSSILSKTGVFGAIMLSVNTFYHGEIWGKALITIAVITMLWGGVLAIFSFDFKKTVAYSSMSQIGFIFTGIAMLGIMGDHNTIASLGTVWHMLNHTVFKLILFSLCSVIFACVGTTHFNGIKGIARKNPIIAALFLLAACGLAGVPGLGGYISKTLLHESIVEHIHLHPDALLSFYEILFVVAGGFTTAYMLKIGFVLFAKNESAPRVSVSVGGLISLIICATVAILGGVLPQAFTEILIPQTAGVMNAHTDILHIHFFSWVNLKGALYSLAIGVLLYFIIVRTLIKEKDHDSISLENLVYMPIFTKLIPKVLGLISTFLSDYLIDYIFIAIFFVINVTSYVISNITDTFTRFFSAFALSPAKERSMLDRSTTSYKFGHVFDYITHLVNHGTGHDYAEKFSKFEETSATRRKMIESSLSYGLFFAGLGLIAVLIYLFIN